MKPIAVIFFAILAQQAHCRSLKSYLDSCRQEIFGSKQQLYEKYHQWLHIAVPLYDSDVENSLSKLCTIAEKENNEFGRNIYKLHYAKWLTQKSGQYNVGLQLTQEALQFFDINNFTHQQIDAQINVGFYKLWNEIASKNVALNSTIFSSYLAPAYSAAQNCRDSNAMVNALNYIGSFHIVSEQNLVKALSAFERALAIEKLHPNEQLRTEALASMVITYCDSGSQRHVAQYLGQLEACPFFSIHLYAQCNVYRSLARFYSNSNMPLAKEYAYKALYAATTAGNIELLALSNKRLYEIFSVAKNNDSALAYLEVYNKCNDDIARSKFEFSFNQLDLANKEKIILEQDNKLQTVKIWLISIVAILGLVLGATYVMWQIKRKNHQLRVQKLKQQQQQQLETVVRSAETEERKRISGNLHDNVVQKLVVAKMNIETIQKNKGISEQDKNEILDSVANLVDNTTTELRTLSHSLMPANLEEEGLIEAVRAIVSKIKSKELVVQVYDEGNFEALPIAIAIIACRAVQELLQNAIKHAMAKEINIHLEATSNSIDISVEDDGIGFDPNALQKQNGIGLTNLALKLKQLGGTFHVDSRIGNGTLATIKIPL